MPPRDDLADLKSRVRLSTHVVRRVKLTGSGSGDRFGRCPFHEERSASFSVNDGKGFYHCFGCQAHGDILDWWRKIEGLSFAEAMDRLREEAGMAAPVTQARPPREDVDPKAIQRQLTARSIWTETVPIEGTIAETYLRQARCIEISPLPASLRFHEGLSPDPRLLDLLPAMVASVTNLAGEVVAIQRTFLREDGLSKASIAGPKRSLGPIGQGAVCLAEAGRVLGLAEGIETGLSAMQLFRVPVWCALGSNLAGIALPVLVRQVVLFADRGEAGERAAQKARQEFHGQKRQVAVRFSQEGKDFNDALRARRRG